MGSIRIKKSIEPVQDFEAIPYAKKIYWVFLVLLLV
jgi:hypothetical protein